MPCCFPGLPLTRAARVPPPLLCACAASELSSVQLLDREELINRLVNEALTADFEGGCWGFWAGAELVEE